MSVEISQLKLTSKVKTSRDAVISILSDAKPLTAKEIYTRVMREFGMNITYQAIYKTLKEIESEGILKKDKDRYSIDFIWIENNKKLLEDLEKKLLEKSAENKESTVIESDTYHGFGRILLQRFAHDFDKGIFTETCSFQNHLWWTLALQKDEYDWFKKIGKAKAHIVCKNNTLFDKCMATVYRLAGHKVKLGINYNSNCDLVVYSSKIYQIYLPEKLKSDIDNSTKELKNSLGLFKKDYQNIMYSKTDKIKIIIIEDKELASQIRNQIKSEFGREKHD